MRPKQFLSSHSSTDGIGLCEKFPLGGIIFFEIRKWKSIVSSSSECVPHLAMV
jgi:hypothetical protein